MKVNTHTHTHTHTQVLSNVSLMQPEPQTAFDDPEMLHFGPLAARCLVCLSPSTLYITFRDKRTQRGPSAKKTVMEDSLELSRSCDWLQQGQTKD